MALEIEIKFLHADHDTLRQRLAGLGAQPLGRWFESNQVFDDDTRSLKARGTLLRLRLRQGTHILTLKRAAAQTSTTAKVYEESETEVKDAGALCAILHGLGLGPVLRYEKVREKWKLLGCEVCLDLLPFGSFAEIEGPEAGIQACAQALDLPTTQSSLATYHELNRSHREAHSLAADESFVFDPGTRARLIRDLDTDCSPCPSTTPNKCLP